jgi:hypothetical protein
MDPDKIQLENLSKNFEYVKASMEIDSIDDLDDLRNIAKSYMKLYYETARSFIRNAFFNKS